MSFALTTDQIKARTKTVTRRCGWEFLGPGDLVRAIVKGQGLKKGERVTPLAVLRIESVRREPLSSVDEDEVAREGFAHLSPAEFIRFFMASHGIKFPHTTVTRIEFSYTDAPASALTRPARKPA